MPALKRKAAPTESNGITLNKDKCEEVDVAEEAAASPSAAKRRKVDEHNVKLDYADLSRFQESRIAEEHGIVERNFYPPVMSLERAKKYATGEIEKPFTTLKKALAETKQQRDAIEIGDAVIHWFRMDVRLGDNKALSLAAGKAKSKGVPLICIYILSPQDFRAHFTAPVRVDFLLRNLEVVQRDLALLDIPLYMETVEKRKRIPARLIELCKEWEAKHVFANMEYEVDELRRDATIVRECAAAGIAFDVLHDGCIVEPGMLTTNAGGQISVYSPWYRKWCKYIADHPDTLKEYPRPEQNPPEARQKYKALFDVPIPPVPEDRQLTDEEKERFHGLWPVGEDEAMARLNKFIKERIKVYHTNRNLPAGNHTSAISPHLTAGTLAARTCVRESLKAINKTVPTDDRENGSMKWIGEVAWRDFYRHVLCAWPYICMNVPFKPEYNNIEWEYNEEQFTAWKEGKTGYPIIDAAMRQVKHMAYMHNRVRMNTASFLAKHLMIDWRMGERYFMENLIDGDFASNNGGWGFCASCGVDPQPYFRIFNPLLQSEKFDESGEYIRKWVPELKDVKGKAIHDPYSRGAGAIASKNGYPKPIVNHKESRERCLARYKAGIGRATA